MPNTLQDYRLIIQEDGNMTLSQRIKQMIPCQIESDKHPFSNTSCTLEWKYLNVADYQKVIIESTNVTDSVETKYSGSLLLETVKFELTKDEDPSLVYSFTQNPQDLLINFFLPSLLFLIPPWLTLLLGPMAITRCCILMTSLILLSMHYHSSIPIVLGATGVNAISIWKLFTYFFVISIVIELIIITLFASMGRSKTCCFAKRRSAKYEMEPLYEEMNDLRQRKTRFD
uniref:Neur_chan_LBD domain-containing protein n=2 Tax=Caenorhabditis tropicalis TaxID=1561998 RepID=A0A1I7U7J2_9PELO